MTNLNVKEFKTNIGGDLTSLTTIDNKTYEIQSGSDVKLENNKTATISTSAEITPSEGYDAMKKVTITLNNAVPVYNAGEGDVGDEDESDIQTDEALLLFSDAGLTTPLDPSTLTSSDEVYALYLSATEVLGWGFTSTLVGDAVTVNALKLGVDIVDTKFIRFDGDVSGSTVYIVIDQTSTPTQMTWLKALTTYRT
jgi:hypothetical protein